MSGANFELTPTVLVTYEVGLQNEVITMLDIEAFSVIWEEHANTHRWHSMRAALGAQDWSYQPIDKLQKAHISARMMETGAKMSVHAMRP